MSGTLSEAYSRSQVQYVEVSEDNVGQRIDNFLLSLLKGVPRSYIYRILRKGEVRVNKGRVKAHLKLKVGDKIRIPPVRLPKVGEKPVPPRDLVETLKQQVLFEDEGLLVINKPSGLAVHGGSGIRLGLIETLRHTYPKLSQLELVHRLDRDTSGCLMIAKRRSALVAIQKQWRNRNVNKKYWALVKGNWNPNVRIVEAPLQKNQLASGERMVRVHVEGKPSTTEFRILNKFKEATLIEANPVTGRTHQIRVHSQFSGHPILGDEKYCDRDTLKATQKQGVKRLCLHARNIEFISPASQERVKVEAPLDEAFQSLLDNWPSKN